jgi:hypothetical protein
MSNQEEVELRAKIEALGLEVTKVPEQAPKHLSEVNADALIMFTFSLHYAPLLFVLSAPIWPSLARNSCRAGQAIIEA